MNFSTLLQDKARFCHAFGHAHAHAHANANDVSEPLIPKHDHAMLLLMEWNEAFNFSSDLTFLARCAKETKSMIFMVSFRRAN